MAQAFPGFAKVSRWNPKEHCWEGFVSLQSDFRTASINFISGTDGLFVSSTSFGKKAGAPLPVLRNEYYEAAWREVVRRRRMDRRHKAKVSKARGGLSVRR